MPVTFATLVLAPLLAIASEPPATVTPVATVAPAAAAPTLAPAARPAIVLSADECAVFARELSFAQSVADHDAAAFAGHVAPDAAFGAGSPHPQRGRDAIVRAWTPIIRGDGIRLEWYPARTTVVGDLAWSTGPALTEQLDGSTPRFLVGGFQSVWRRGVDGTWQVVFDGGTPPKEVDAQAAAAFRAARPTVCPGA